MEHMVNAPWYIRNSELHQDLGMSDEISEIKRLEVMKQESRLRDHILHTCGNHC